MASLRFRLVNVFVGPTERTENALAGNPLCVIEDASALDLGRMMAITRQFNLSETTFILPPPADSEATARVRIGTPTADPAMFEMTFAGHPTLGTAHVLRDLRGGGDRVVLSLPAGDVPVEGVGDRWMLTAPTSGAPRTRAEPMPAASVAALVGLSAADLAGDPLWLDTGTEQLMLPLVSAEAVARCRPDFSAHWPRNPAGRSNCYPFAIGRADGPDGRIAVRSRFFILEDGASGYEDPGTGSACANLGGWLITTGATRPGRYQIDQGVEMQRPCRLLLDLTAEGLIRVGGRVLELGRGELRLP